MKASIFLFIFIVGMSWWLYEPSPGLMWLRFHGTVRIVGEPLKGYAKPGTQVVKFPAWAVNFRYDTDWTKHPIDWALTPLY